MPRSLPFSQCSSTFLGAEGIMVQLTKCDCSAVLNPAFSSEPSAYLFLIRFITSRSKDYFPAIACSFALPPAFSGTLVHEEQNNQRACEIGLLAHCDDSLFQVY